MTRRQVIAKRSFSCFDSPTDSLRRFYLVSSNDKDKYLEFVNIDVGHRVPTWIASFVVTVESQTGIITYRIGEQPGVIVLETREHSRRHQIPYFVEYICLLQELVFCKTSENVGDVASTGEIILTYLLAAVSGRLG